MKFMAYIVKAYEFEAESMREASRMSKHEIERNGVFVFEELDEVETLNPEPLDPSMIQRLKELELKAQGDKSQ